jgi:3-methyladenine DNA glycosylase AlkD/uncharacterized protein YdhG (YjbR/CyaY superfamily)
MPAKPSDTDAYLAKLSPDKRATLAKVRAAIRAAAPAATECISYGMPAFILGKPIAGYSASARHCSYFPMSGAITTALAADLKGYATSKGGIRFPMGKPPPAALIRKLVKARLAEIAAGTLKRKSRSRNAAAGTAGREVATILRELERKASKRYRDDMRARYGIVTKAVVYGTPVAQLKAIARRLGRDHDLADALWRSGVHDARMLATMVADPVRLTAAQMSRWAKDFDNWGIVDSACFSLFDRTPHAFRQVERWAGAKDEFVKRAAFALLASAALHGHGAQADHLRGLALIERAAGDPRNFVKKGVSWALRAIGGSNDRRVRAAAHDLARRLAASADAAQRWVGKDAVKAFGKARK